MKLPAHTPPAAALHAYLREQQDLTPVEIFARAHDGGALEADEPHYRSLLPAHGPLPGQQYAFEVDLDRCSGCKACVTGCHNRNGLDDGEIWRSVGLILSGDDEAPVVQHVTGACHHCVDPACLNGCPVRAYEKDPVTGIVRHLDDQCIGCRYCVMKCPYGVPQYNEARGIVRKCDLCTERLAAGEAPACVQSCPNEAIRITLVDAERGVEASRDGFAAVAGAPDAAYTQPTTRYRTRVSTGPALAVERPLEPAESHPALVVMLILTQAAAGVVMFNRAIGGESDGVLPVLATVLAFTGMIAATAHLGRPWWAFRAVLGLRTSWLSREIVAFGAFVVLGACTPIAGWIDPQAGSVFGLLAALSGAAAVCCSAKVYEDTPRPYWASRRTTVRFLLSTAAGGAVISAAVRPDDFAAVALLAVTAKLLFELGDSGRITDSGRLLSGPLCSAVRLRLLLAAASAALLLAAFAAPQAGWAAALAWFAGECIERHLFFRAAAAPRMP